MSISIILVGTAKPWIIKLLIRSVITSWRWCHCPLIWSYHINSHSLQGIGATCSAFLISTVHCFISLTSYWVLVLESLLRIRESILSHLVWLSIISIHRRKASITRLLRSIKLLLHSVYLISLVNDQLLIDFSKFLTLIKRRQKFIIVLPEALILLRDLLLLLVCYHFCGLYELLLHHTWLASNWGSNLTSDWRSKLRW